MNKTFFLISFFFFRAIFLSGTEYPAQASVLHHELNIKFDQELNQVKGEDVITIKDRDYLENLNSMTFILHQNYEISPSSILSHLKQHKGLKIQITSIPTRKLKQVTIKKTRESPWPDPFTLFFRYGNSSGQASGEPSNNQLFLSGNSYFYPIPLEMDQKLPHLHTFNLKVETPEQWKVVSQGFRIQESIADKKRFTHWQSNHPMEEIFLIMGRFHEFKSDIGPNTFYAFLRTKDRKLEKKYFHATKAYLEFYEKLLGSYPYKKFALIENVEQTGFGMPSFTLLGSRIIRFPFILYSSYPHEILHNWWGNGVYVDPRSGNWSEGLTSYLSDHLLAELKGKGDRYRFQQLVNYLNYVRNSNDFSLTNFSSRNDMASQAIGYGKTLMLFHMLREEIGDKKFLAGLKRLYADYRFKHAGYDEIRNSFESTSGENFPSFFNQWTTRVGAPKLRLEQVSILKKKSKFSLDFTVEQTQKGYPFNFLLPIGIWINENPKESLPFKIHKLRIRRKSQHFSISLKDRPQKFVLDPYYDIFRTLNREDVPPSIGQTFGADSSILIINSESNTSCQKFAKSLKDSNQNIVLSISDDLKSDLPRQALWLLGKNNRVAKRLKVQLNEQSIIFNQSGVTIDKKHFSFKNHSFVFTLKHPDSLKYAVTWVIPGPQKTVSGLIRKLPHYGKFGYMVFGGNEPNNIIKGVWPAENRQLTHQFRPGKFFLPAKKPLVQNSPDISH